MKVLSYFFLSAILLISNLHAQQNRYFNLKQPNGETFKVIERGYDWLHFYETEEGYIVRPGVNGYFEYHTINNQGKFASTNLRVKIDSPANPTSTVRVVSSIFTIKIY